MRTLVWPHASALTIAGLQWLISASSEVHLTYSAPGHDEIAGGIYNMRIIVGAGYTSAAGIARGLSDDSHKWRGGAFVVRKRAGP